MALDQETLNRMFSNAFSPIDTLGRGQLVVAEDRLNRQRILDDAARRIFQENEYLGKQQKFSKEQAEASRLFQASESEKERTARTALSEVSEKRQLAVIEKQQDEIEERAKEVRKEASRLLDNQRKINTDTYVRLKRDADKLEREVADLGNIPRSLKNQWASEIARKNGASETLIKAAFDPSSSSDISQNFTKLGKSAAIASDELEKRETSYYERIRPQLILKAEELKGIKDEARTLVRNVDFSLIPESRREDAALDLGPVVQSAQGAPSDIATFLNQSGVNIPTAAPAANPNIVKGIFPTIGQAVGDFVRPAIGRVTSAVGREVGSIRREAGNLGATLFGGTIQQPPSEVPVAVPQPSAATSLFDPIRATALRAQFATQPVINNQTDVSAKIQQTKDAIRGFAKRSGISDIQIEDIIVRADAGEPTAKAEVMRLAQQLKAETEQAKQVFRSGF